MANEALIAAEETAGLNPFLGRVISYVRQSRSGNTLRAYKSDWRHFSTFSESLGILPMPATPEIVASYLSACADSGLKAGSIQRRVSAITAMHRAAGHESPTSNPAVKLCLAGIRRAIGVGVFRSHVARLVSFLKSLTGLFSQQQEVVAAVIVLAGKGTAPAGEWITLARTSGNHWKDVEKSVLST